MDDLHVYKGNHGDGTRVLTSFNPDSHCDLRAA